MSQAEYRRESSMPADAEAMRHSHGMPQGGLSQYGPANDLVEYLKDYARQRPEVAARWCFGIGFVLGWKLKPW